MLTVVSFLLWFKRFDSELVVIAMINESFMPQESSGTDRHHGKFRVGLSTRQYTMYCGFAKDLAPKGRNFGWI
jgi:hypothetical protein